MKLQLIAPAKINLGLRILGKLPNGRHEVETIYAQIKLFDLIELEKITGKRIDFPDKNNLVYRAAKLLFKDQGVRIKLIKRIPIGSGLGGGSSDAAAVLTGLNQLWKLKLSQSQLIELAKTLGSDVGYFLIGGIQQETQGGDKAGKFKELGKLINGWLVVCWPGITITSKEAYAEIQYDKIGKNKVLWHNDFEIWTLNQYPEIRKIKAIMVKNGARQSLMSGKGSAVFGMYNHRNKAEKAIKELRKIYKNTWLMEAND